MYSKVGHASIGYVTPWEQHEYDHLARYSSGLYRPKRGGIQCSVYAQSPCHMRSALHTCTWLHVGRQGAMYVLNIAREFFEAARGTQTNTANLHNISAILHSAARLRSLADFFGCIDIDTA